VNDTLGINVIDIERTNLDFGLDLRGGTRILLKPKENATKDMIDQFIATLQTRANIYGLQEMTFTPVGTGDGWYVQVEAAGLGSSIVENLLEKQGSFEGKIVKPVAISGGTGTLTVGSESWNVQVQDDSLIVDGQILTNDNSIELADMRVEYSNKTLDTAYLLFTVYTGKDIELVYTDPQNSGMAPRQNSYEFYFAVLVSQEGAQKFADVTATIPKYLDIAVGDEYLDSRILLFLDGQVVSDLRISGDLGGQVVQKPSITGSRPDRDEAIEEKMRLQTILRSGALPTTLETESVFIVPPTLGVNFFSTAGMAIVLAAIVVVVIVFIRYRSLKISVPILVVGLSEVVIILGIASKGDTGIWAIVLLVNMAIVALAWWKKQEIDIYAWIGAFLIPLLGMMSWTIDLPAIGGIIAAIGTGVDHQIIIADETVKGEPKEKGLLGIKDRIKRAFFIIFGAAATTIFAMVPLIFLGVGLVRGFAITTIIGVLVGILITRPAYARMIEALIKRKH
jgi:preprotein translocase subunit SecD